MTPPAVALLRLGSGPWWIPLPLILLCPFLLLALAFGGLVEAVTCGGSVKRTRTLWDASKHLRGVQVDVESAEGRRLFLWLV